MARRTVMDEVEYTPPPEERQPPRERTRRAKAKPAPESRRRRIQLMYWVVPFVGVILLAAGMIVFHRVEAFLINDARFALPGPLDAGVENPKIEGLHRVKREEVLRIFENDLGRSLYLFPAAERRRNLLAFDWIKEATVSRRWPNQIYVQVREREPFAFVQFDRRGGPPSFRLIDEQGVLLPIPKGEKFDLAVLTGIPPTENEAQRAARVRVAAVMWRELGALASQISEIDVHDPADLRVTMKLEGTPVILLIGDRNFRPRLEGFLRYFATIREKRPDAVTFDLRVDDRITASDDLGRPDGKGGASRVVR